MNPENPTKNQIFEKNAIKIQKYCVKKLKKNIVLKIQTIKVLKNTRYTVLKNLVLKKF